MNNDLKITLFFEEGECRDSFEQLVRLHPGKNALEVIKLALMVYHFLYDMNLQGTDIRASEVLNHIDKLDDEERNNNEQ